MWPSDKHNILKTLDLNAQWLAVYKTHLDEHETAIIKKRSENLKTVLNDKKQRQQQFQMFSNDFLNIYQKHFTSYADQQKAYDLMLTTFTSRFNIDQAVFVPKENTHGLIFDINESDGTYIVCDSTEQCFRCHEIEIIEKTT